MLYVLGEIHPFADGNGRVARLLYLMLTGDDMPRTVDWGVIEQLRYHQDDWFPLLKDRDVGPSASFAVELSIAGARLMSERLRVLTLLLPEVGRTLGAAPLGAELVAAVWLRRSARVDEAAVDAGLAYGEAVVTAEALVTAGLLERRRSEDPGVPARPTYGLTSEVVATVDRIARQLADRTGVPTVGNSSLGTAR